MKLPAGYWRGDAGGGAVTKAPVKEDCTETGCGTRVIKLEGGPKVESRRKERWVYRKRVERMFFRRTAIALK